MQIFHFSGMFAVAMGRMLHSAFAQTYPRISRTVVVNLLLYQQIANVSGMGRGAAMSRYNRWQALCTTAMWVI